MEIALGSVFEVVAASNLVMDRVYLTKEQHEDIYASGERLSKSINAFRNTLLSPDS
ncbi:MAG: four helix bundle protein [Nitrospira sp.]|nr:four helix bundle protein [Nitrospira sp.]